MSVASQAVAREFDWDRSAEKLEPALLQYLGEDTKLQTPNTKLQAVGGTA